MKQHIMIKVQMAYDMCRSKAMAATTVGVDSVTQAGDDTCTHGTTTSTLRTRRQSTSTPVAPMDTSSALVGKELPVAHQFLLLVAQALRHW